jgi:hypothetical protein
LARSHDQALVEYWQVLELTDWAAWGDPLPKRMMADDDNPGNDEVGLTIHVVPTQGDGFGEGALFSASRLRSANAYVDQDSIVLVLPLR